MNGFFATGFVMSCIASWLTSFVYAIKYDRVVILLADIFLPPFGIVHGWGLWFGWW